MVIFGLFDTGDVPFRDVFIHPVIQDGLGRRMSKSLGNGIDPVDIIDLYGADALRFTLAFSATETQDLRMPVERTKLPDGREVNTSERFEQGRTFPNKFWNAARFALMNLDGYEPARVDPASLPVEDRWIMDGLSRLASETTADLAAFRFAEAARRLRDFTWNDFCDWYLEIIKGRLRDDASRPTAQRVLATLLDGLCRLLHPIMPFVTEQVWQTLRELAPERGLPAPQASAESVCIAAWPITGLDPVHVLWPADTWRDEESGAIVESWREKIATIRNLRAERNVPPAAKVTPIIVADGVTAERLRRGLASIESLTNASTVTIVPNAERPAECAVAVLGDAEIILPLAGLIDREAESQRHRKTLTDLDKQIASVRGKLDNASFVARAPAEVVEAQRAKLGELLAQRGAVAKLLGEA
jgi:valyl-tRNA synthetase